MTHSDSGRGARRALQLALLALLALALTAGCSALDEQQRRWIFQPSKESWGGGAGAAGIADVWIDLHAASGSAARLHALWLPQPRADAPLVLYLHGARWDVRSSAGRMRRLHDAGYTVLGIDYRGFGLSSDALPSQASALEDARAAWDWLGRRQPGSPRYMYGHSLGSAIGVELAADLQADAADVAAGIVLEGAFTSIPDVVATFRYGWLPLGPFVTQRFDAAARVAELHVPLLVVHGSADRTIDPALGRALYERAAGPKRFVLVDGGTHHDASARGAADVRAAMLQLFGDPATRRLAGRPADVTTLPQ